MPNGTSGEAQSCRWLISTSACMRMAHFSRFETFSHDACDALDVCLGHRVRAQNVHHSPHITHIYGGNSLGMEINLKYFYTVIVMELPIFVFVRKCYTRSQC
eukprot:6189388-Pleurochrysis_carterae.AAC.1